MPMLSDDEFLHAFHTCTLEAAQFDHHAHVRIAWILARRCPLPDAIEQVCVGIQCLATHFGAPEKFNRTMTEALVRWIAHGARADCDFEAFAATHPQLFTDVRGLLARHYSPERLTSLEAKRMFVVPDREPLPHVD